MNPDLFLREFSCLTEAGGGFEQLRGLVLQLGIMGRLVPQDPRDQPVEEQLARIGAERTKPSVRSSTRMQREMVASPFEAPLGWAWASLNDVAMFINGDRSKNYPSKPHQVAEGIPFINAGHLKGGRIDLSEMNYITEERFELLRSGKVQRGDLLYCLRGSLGKAAIVDGIDRGAIASSLLIIRPAAGLCSAKYLLHYLASFLGRAMILRYDNGTAQPNLSAADVAKYAVPLPPLAEQKRIVAKVDQLMALCDDLETKQTKKRDLATQSTRSALTELASAETPKEIAAAWRRLGNNPELLTISPDLLIDWRSTILALLVDGHLWCDRAGSAWPQVPVSEILAEPLANGRSVPDGRGGFPVLRLSAFRGRTLDFRHMKEGAWTIEQARSFIVRPGDVFFVRGNGAIRLVGRACLAEKVPVDVAFPDTAIRARLKPLVVDPLWLWHVWESPQTRVQIEVLARTTAGIFKVSQDDILAVTIPLPPLTEQKRIVAKLDHLMSVLDDLEAKLRKQEETATRLAESLASAVAARKD